MFKFIARRVLETIPVLFIIITGSFFLIKSVPGGPFDSERRTSPEIQRNLNEYYGLDKPLPVQYVRYLGNILHGDLGPSYRYASRTVNEIIADSAPVSFELGCYGMAIALLIGITAGIVASLRPNSATDYVPMTLAMVGVCLPTFVLGPLLVLGLAMYKGVDLSAATEVALVLLPTVVSGIWLRRWWAGAARMTRAGARALAALAGSGAWWVRVAVAVAVAAGMMVLRLIVPPVFLWLIEKSFWLVTLVLPAIRDRISVETLVTKGVWLLLFIVPVLNILLAVAAVVALLMLLAGPLGLLAELVFSVLLRGGMRAWWQRHAGLVLAPLAGAACGGLLMFFITSDHQWFYPSGWNFAPDRVLPSLTLGIFYAAYLARLTRGGMMEILNQDFIRTARAKGAGEGRVILKHALRGGLLPVVSFLGPALAGIISGSFVVEKIFQIPGLGQQFVTSATNRDHTMILGTVIFFAVLIIFFNLLVDVVQVLLNPRLRFD